MNWPPPKAWTNKVSINGHIHFVAINHGGELLNKWVVLMSVLDSSVTVRLPWNELVDSSDWQTGWNEVSDAETYKLFINKNDLKTVEFYQPSNDSGLTIPISEKNIRPWFINI